MPTPVENRQAALLYRFRTVLGLKTFVDRLWPAEGASFEINGRRSPLKIQSFSTLLEKWEKINDNENTTLHCGHVTGSDNRWWPDRPAGYSRRQLPATTIHTSSC